MADVLSGHVRFEVECIDRMYLIVYQPKLQYAADLVGYVRRQLCPPIASTTLASAANGIFALIPI